MCRIDRRVGFLAVVLVAAVVLSAGQVGATTVPPPPPDYGDGGNGTQDGVDGSVTITAQTVSFPAGAEGSTDPRCTTSSIQVYIDDDFATAVTTDFFLSDAFDGSTLNSFWFTAAQGRGSGVRLFSPTGRWFGAFCDGALAFVPEGGPSVSIPGLVQRVVDQLDPPAPDLEVTPHHGRHVVQMQSWLAVDPLYWNAPRRATANSGRVTVTAWLDPFEVIWNMGNGETEGCLGPGLVYRPGMADSQSTCHYTYDWPSIDPPDNTYELEGTVRFNVGHTTNAPGTYGPFVPVERTSGETIEVVEIQAVES